MNGFEIVLTERKAVVFFFYILSHFLIIIVLCAVVIADFDFALCDRRCRLIIISKYITQSLIRIKLLFLSAGYPVNLG